MNSSNVKFGCIILFVTTITTCSGAPFLDEGNSFFSISKHHLQNYVCIELIFSKHFRPNLQLI